MRLNTERKVCAGVLTLAVVALGVDRLLLGGGVTGPSLAAAASSEIAPTDGAGVEPARAPAVLQVTTIPVAKQLEALQTVARDVDGFAPPARWQQALALVRAAEEARAPQAPAATDDPSRDPRVQRFMRHQLTAVLSEAGVPSKALIRVADGETGRGYSKLFAIGEQLDGFTLSSLRADRGETRATFVNLSTSTAIDLELPLGGESGGAREVVGPNKRP